MNEEIAYLDAKSPRWATNADPASLVDVIDQFTAMGYTLRIDKCRSGAHFVVEALADNDGQTVVVDMFIAQSLPYAIRRLVEEVGLVTVTAVRP